MRLRARIALATAVAAALNGGVAGAAPWDQRDARLVPPGTVAATISGTTATVSWQPAAEPVPVSYAVSGYDTSGGPLSVRSCVGCTSMTWAGLRPGVSYQFAVAAYSQVGRSVGIAAPVVTASDPLCATAATAGHVCVGVDTASSLGSEPHAGSGFLHGVTSQTPTSLIASVAPTSWREAALTPEAVVAAGSGAPVTVVLSDAWWNATYTTARGGAISPWSDWNAYSAFIQKTVLAQEAAIGSSNVYFDIQNEPETPGWYDPAAPATTALVLQEYSVGYQAIKTADPNAKIVGPSIDWAFVSSSFPVDMKTFLDYAAANGLRFDALSWHENGKGETADRFPEAVAQHVADVRAYVAQHPSLGDPAIFINEYAGSATGLLPGWITSYFSAFDAVNVAQADHSCASNAQCFSVPGLLDGILVGDGTITTPAALTYQRYAAMSGQRLYWVSSDDHVNVVATRDADGTTRLLIGRDSVCPSWIVAGCAASVAPTAPVTIDLALAGVGRAGATVHTELLPAATTALAGPVDLGTQAVDSAGRLSLPALADGAALAVTVSSCSLTPQGFAHPAATRPSLRAATLSMRWNTCGPSGPATRMPAARVATVQSRRVPAPSSVSR